MFRKALLGLVVIAVFAAGCKSTVEKQGEVTLPAPAPVAAPTPSDPAPSTPPAPTPVAQGYEILKITADLSQELVDGANRQGCPSSALSALFGVNFTSMHGCVLGNVAPGGLAEQIGLRTGDSIVGCNGGEATCPRTLVPLLRPGKVELIVHRPKSG
jgi:hypothetical protein